MKKLYFFTVSLGILALTNNNCSKQNADSHEIDSKKDSAIVNQSDISIEEIPENCYSRFTDKDSTYLKISDNLGTIVGKMTYYSKENGNSNGTVSGIADGDTLKLDYTYDKDGTEIMKEVWILKKNDELIQASGTYDATGSQYVNTKKLSFDDKNSLKKSNCREIAPFLK